VDKRNLALDEATHEDFVAVANGSRHREDLATLRMRPPATPNWLSSNDLSKRRDRSIGRLEYDPVFTNESERLA
jgi:hypothetical protein